VNVYVCVNVYVQLKLVARDERGAESVRYMRVNVIPVVIPVFPQYDTASRVLSLCFTAVCRHISVRNHFSLKVVIISSISAMVIITMNMLMLCCLGEKTVQNYFSRNFVKFPQTMKIIRTDGKGDKLM